jgi:hypothetical protein
VTHGRFLLLYALALPVALLAAHFSLGGPAVLAIGVAAILALAARFDNHSGSCLMVAIILILVLGVILSLMMLTYSIGGRE